MPFQSSHERFLRDRIADAESQASGVEQEKAVERERLAEFQRQHTARLAELDRKLETAEAALSAFRDALGNFLESRTDLRPTRRKPGASTRRRGASAQWQKIWAQVPKSPHPGFAVSEIVEIVDRIKPGMTRAAVRSQLTAEKKARRMENIHGRWRRIAAEAEEIEASDDTSGEHRPSEASNGAGDWRSPGTP
jgi:hypothetical protein